MWPCPVPLQRADFCRCERAQLVNDPPMIIRCPFGTHTVSESRTNGANGSSVATTSDIAMLRRRQLCRDRTLWARARAFDHMFRMFRIPARGREGRGRSAVQRRGRAGRSPHRPPQGLGGGPTFERRPKGMTMGGALHGIKVLDLTHARAGPTCTRQLADFGAEVIMVRSPHRGEALTGQQSDDDNLRRGKQSVLIDMRAPGGLDTFLRLVDQADVVVENFRPQVKFRLGIDPESLWERNPRLVYASISGYGQVGPEADRAGVDPVVQAMSGLMSVTGQPGTGPWRAGIAVSDVASGTFLTQGILAALVARERTGVGQWVSTSVLEAMVDFMEFQALRWLNEGEVPAQVGNMHPQIYGSNTYETADGHLAVFLMRDADYLKLFDVCGASHLAEDSRFSTGAARSEHRETLIETMRALFREQPTSYWVSRLVAADIPTQPVQRLDEVFAHPQIQALELTRSISAPGGRTTTVLRHPVTMSATPTDFRPAVSSAGQDTVEVLLAHGFEADEVDRLVAARAVSSANFAD
jgi:crotonobetainyl-CoA:carnitine CoA-transferase CaiB-like acyl-CoA transferase